MDGALKPSDDLALADWIAPRLTGAPGAVTGSVPSGFAAYARICHPATDAAGASVSWAQVAAATGRRAHPLMQWQALVGSVPWPGVPPSLGNLAPELLVRLTDLLAGYTGTPSDCVFALWEGWGHGTKIVVTAEWTGALPAEGSVDALRPPLFAPVPLQPSPSARHEPRVHLPRACLLFTSPLGRAGRVGDQVTPDWFLGQSPNVFWPADRAWCVASEIDVDSTLVAGAQALVDAVLADPGLDAWPVRPGDRLSFDADVVNPPS